MGVRWRGLVLIMFASLLLLCIQNGGINELSVNESKEKYCDKLWRYDIECAIDYMFTPENLKKISGIAEGLKGEDCRETAWNVLGWVDKNVEYDYEKSMLPPPEIEISPKGVEVYNQMRYIQTPSETILTGKGICTDYTFLIAALLYYNGCQPYIVNITFKENTVGHVSAAVKINNTYYFLDQHLPPLDPGGYYRKWVRQGRTILDAEVYSPNGSVDAVDFSDDYRMKNQDLADLIEDMSAIIKNKGLKEDSRLGEKLPAGYSEGKILTLKMENMADYYTPVFKKEFAGYIVDKILAGDELKIYRSFKLDARISGADLVVKLYLAR